MLPYISIGGRGYAGQELMEEFQAKQDLAREVGFLHWGAVMFWGGRAFGGEGCLGGGWPSTDKASDAPLF